MTIAYTYEPKGGALALMRCRAPEILIEGPRNTGKTRGVLNKIFLFVRKHKKCRVLIVRATRASLTESVLVEWEDNVVPPGHPMLQGADRAHRGRYEIAETESEIVLGGLDNAERFRSGQYDLIYVAEATDCREEDIETLTGSLRNKRAPYQQIICDCNPKHPGHWLNRRPERKRESGGPQMTRILSRHEDNPACTADDLERLRNLTGIRRQRDYEGKWVAAEGLIYDFDRARHVKTPAWTKHPKRIIIGVDQGFRNPFAALRALVNSDDSLHIEAERYGSGKSESVKVADAVAISKGADRVMVDPSAAELIAALQRANLPAEGANNAVTAGISPLEDAFKQDRITISPECVSLIRELETYEWADSDAKDKPVKENDHACDALRYLSQAIAPTGSCVAVGMGESVPLGPECPEGQHQHAEQDDGTMRCGKCGHQKVPTIGELQERAVADWMNEV